MYIQETLLFASEGRSNYRIPSIVADRHGNVYAFCNDRKGYRLGYGGGYYDRFLSQYSGWTVGINYSECVRDELQPGRYDVPIQMLLTERDKLYFK